MRSSAWLIVGGYTLNCLIWSSTWMAIKIGLRGAPPISAVGVRFAIAAVVIATIVAVARLPIPRTRGFWGISLFLGLWHLSIPYILVYWGEQHISSGMTAVLYSTMPLMVALLARVLIGDLLTARKLIGIAVGVAGVWVVFSDAVHVGGHGQALGMSAVLGSVFSAALASVLIKKYSGAYHPFVSMLIPFIVGALVVNAIGIPLEKSNPLHYDGPTWATILYLALAGSVVAFAVFFWLMKRVDVTVISYQTFIIPILAILWGWIFLGETISSRAGAGAACILTGIVIATARRRRRKEAVK